MRKVGQGKLAQMTLMCATDHFAFCEFIKNLVEYDSDAQQIIDTKFKGTACLTETKPTLASICMVAICQLTDHYDLST